MQLDWARESSWTMPRVIMSFYSHEESCSTSVPADETANRWSDHEAEAWVLATEAGARLLAEVATTPAPRPADVDQWRKHAPASAVAAAIRLAACRIRARAKFTRADHMWLAPVALEQSTAELVARHKARRFEAGSLVVDLCAGIGGDAIALAERSNVLAVDADPGMCRRLAWNTAVYDVAQRVLPIQARAERFSIPRGAWVHVDPDRRAAGRSRARAIAEYAPGLDFLRDVGRRCPAGAIKLSPASDFAAAFGDPEFEVELVSLNGECKEATVWFGAAATCRRRATRLPENVTWTNQDGGWESMPMDEIKIAPVSSYLYDPDPALLRSGLLDAFARTHRLNRIAAGVDYLTGDSLIDSPFLAAFEVGSVHRLDLKQLRRLVVDQDIGPLEIKVRGLRLTPETLRGRLRARGTQPATLILTGGSGPARAILARRPSPTE